MSQVRLLPGAFLSQVAKWRFVKDSSDTEGDISYRYVYILDGNDAFDFEKVSGSCPACCGFSTGGSGRGGSGGAPCGSGCASAYAGGDGGGGGYPFSANFSWNYSSDAVMKTDVPYTGDMSRGWTHDYYYELLTSDTNEKVFTLKRGNKIDFFVDESDTDILESGIFYVDRYYDDGDTCIRIDIGGAIYQFDDLTDTGSSCRVNIECSL